MKLHFKKDDLGTVPKSPLCILRMDKYIFHNSSHIKKEGKTPYGVFCLLSFLIVKIYAFFVVTFLIINKVTTRITMLIGRVINQFGINPVKIYPINDTPATKSA